MLQKNDVHVEAHAKLGEGRPNIHDYIKNGKVQLIINTPTKKGPQTDEGKIRAMSVLNKVPIVTTITGANAAVRAIEAMKKQGGACGPFRRITRSDLWWMTASSELKLVRKRDVVTRVTTPLVE